MKPHRTIAIGSIVRVLSLAATSLVGFFLMPFLVHRLGDRMFGYWTLIGALLGYYGILDLGITPAVQFQVAKAIGEGDTESPNRALSTAVAAFAGLGLVALAATLVAAACCQFFIKNPADAGIFRAVLIIMGLGFAFGFPGRAFMGGVYAHLRFDISASAGIVVLILRTVLIVVVVEGGGGLVGLAAVSLLSDAITYFANYLILRRIQKGLRISLKLADKATFKELFQYGRHSVVIQIGDQLRFSVDSWIVAGFVGVAAVAHYAVASRLAMYLLILMTGLLGTLGPWFSQLLGGQNYEGIRRTLVLGTKVAAALSTIAVCSFVLYGRAFIDKWMGPRYVDAYWPSLILIAAVFFDIAQQPSISYLLGVSRHRYLAFQTIGEGIANLALSIYWARSYGMIGVALGTLVPMIVAKFLLQPAYVCRTAGIPLAHYYVKVLGGSAVAPAACCLALWVILRNVELSGLGMVCLVVALQGLASALAAFFFVFGAEDRRRVAGKLWPRRQLAGQASNP